MYAKGIKDTKIFGKIVNLLSEKVFAKTLRKLKLMFFIPSDTEIAATLNNYFSNFSKELVFKVTENL